MTPDVERLRHCVLDWLGAAVAGASSPAACAVRSAIALRETGDATVAGTPLRGGVRDVALANGVAAHALEIDDVSRAMRGHPSASICSAVLAVAEARRLNDGDVASGLLCGYDLAGSLGSMFGPGHAAAGWHATGTLGTLASAGACARALRLDSAATQSALGLAATQAAGLTASFGTSGKGLHAGKAAADGVLAALLAERGATGPADAIARLAAATTSTFDPDRPADEPAGVRSIVFKEHACSGVAHPAFDALTTLRSDHGFAATDVRAVEIEAPPAALRACPYDRPRDELEARASFPFAAAVALAGRDGRPEAFDVTEPLLTAVAARVTTRPSDDDRTYVTVVLDDGRRLHADAAPSLPAADAELEAQWLRIVVKFDRLATPVLGPARAESVVAHVRAGSLVRAAASAAADG